MVKKDDELFVCGECGFNYKQEKLAEQCEEWCETHNSCNSELARKAVQ